MDIVLLAWLSYKISVKAKQKGEKPLIWIVRLITMFLTTELVVSFALVQFLGPDYSLVNLVQAEDTSHFVIVIIPALLFSLLTSYFIFRQLDNIENEVEIIEEETEAEEEKPNLDHFR